MMAEIPASPPIGPVTTSVIAPAIGTLATSAIALAMSSFGAFAFALIPFGLMLWRIWAENARLRGENAELRKELTAEKDKRFEDAQKLLEMTRTSIATTNVRAEGDQQFLTMVGRLVDKISDLEDMVRISLSQPPRRRPTR